MLFQLFLEQMFFHFFWMGLMIHSYRANLQKFGKYFFTAAVTYLLLKLNHAFTLDQYIIPSKNIHLGLRQACCAEQCSLVRFLRDKLVNTLSATKLLWHPVLKSLSHSEINPPGERQP